MANTVHAGRYRADFEPGTVVFLIGMRFNSLWRVRDWMPAFLATPKMLAELHRHPELGLLGHTTWLQWRGIMVQQYWRDMDSLLAYAAAPESAHLPAWRAFMKRMRNSASVGIWHEAYEVTPERSHIVYGNMPPSGMAAATGHVDATSGPPQFERRKPVSVPAAGGTTHPETADEEPLVV